MDPGVAFPILPSRDLNETRAFYEPNVSPPVSLMKLARLIKTFSMLCLLSLILQSGCGRATPQRGSESAAEYQPIVERIRGIVAKQLDLKAQEVDVDVPLSKLKKPADELDVIEIIMNVEEEFSIEIKDDEVASGNLSVKALANIVSRKKSHSEGD
jgi:acyl carrier protein